VVPTPAEARLVERLRAEDDAMLSLVARVGTAAVGHVLFSRLAAPFPALALAPLAVRSEHQGRGIGSALVRAGLAEAEARGWRGVFVVGDPGFYRRFGFDPARAQGFATPYPGPFLMARSLGGELPARTGTIA
jgi:putative acetyltransferase